jgi:hypothetical protein
MKIRALVIALVMSVAVITPVQSEELPPKVAVAYDIGFLGDNSYNDAVHEALVQAKKKYRLVEPFVREVPTNGTAVDRLSRLRFLAKSGYTLIITVGSGYRETVKRVSMEFPEIQFAIINDRTLGQLNISNIYFDEFDGAYLAGVLAASNSKRKAVGFIGSDPDLYASFSKGARDTFSKVKVVNIFYPDNISEVKISLAKVDIAYSTWDGDAQVLMTVLDSFPKKVKLILETPDQYFANTRLAQPVILATIEKNLIKPIDQLVSSALQGSALIDVLDEPAGVYGREYNASNGGIRVTTTVPLSSSSRKAVLKALLALK